MGQYPVTSGLTNQADTLEIQKNLAELEKETNDVKAQARHIVRTQVAFPGSHAPTSELPE